MKQKHRLAEKQANESAFLKKQAHEKQSQREAQRQANESSFLQKRAHEKQSEREAQRQANESAFLQKQVHEKQTQREAQREANESSFLQKQAHEKQSQREKEQKKDSITFNEKRAKEKQTGRLKKTDETTNSEFKRKQAFLDSIRDGRTYICISCHRKMYKNGVIPLQDDWKEQVEDKFPGYIDKCIGPILRRKMPRAIKHGCCDNQDIDYLCHACYKNFKKGKMAPMSNQNNLQLVDISKFPELKLTELENQLIALNLIFQKIKLLPKSRWNALIDKTVNVPIPMEEVSNTIKQLPRTPNDAHVIPVQLKRKKNMKNTHRQEYIDCNKVVKAIETMKLMENPHYKDIITSLEDYLKKCQESDAENFKFGSQDQEKGQDEKESSKQNSNDKKSSDDQNEVIHQYDEFSDEEWNSNKEEGDEKEEQDPEDLEEKEHIENDPIRKHQFNYNHTTCFGDNVPEISAENNIVNDEEPLVVAPGEGKIPTDFPENWEAKSFPTHFPDGKDDKDEQRPVDSLTHITLLKE